MPQYFNIYRPSLDGVGCDFETTQTEGDMAGDGTTLQGKIVWYLDAFSGYTVDINDFDIPGATLTVIDPGATHQFTGTLPPPILGVVFDQAGDNRIKITIYLYPVNNGILTIGGPVFEMPGNWVTTALPISGCAHPTPVGETLTLVNNDEHNVDATVVIESDFIKSLSQENLGNGIINITGSVAKDRAGDKLLSYTLTPKTGKRFLSIPNLSISTDDNYTTSSTIKDDSGNIISTTINIFKK
tara:strand:- start:67 stop:792 length:726 start_codon:yes stop_codon:yes gene_type:complete